MQTQFKRFVGNYRKKHYARFNRAHTATRHPFAVPVITIVGLALLTGGLFLAFNTKTDAVNPNVVVISHDGQRQVVSSKEATVKDLLAKLDLKVNEGDVVEPALTTAIQQDDFRINIYRALPVEIIDGASKQFAFSAATTPRSVARQAGMTIYPEDTVVTQPITDFVSTGGIGQAVVVGRATPISVNLYGAPVVMRTHATTVRQLLAEKKVNLQTQDMVSVALDTPITAATQFTVVRNGLTTTTIQEAIAMPTQNIADNTLSYGVSAVRQQGTPGKRAVTYEINTQNGVEVGRKVIQTVVVTEPVPQINVVGANLSGIKGDMSVAGIAPGDYEYVDYIVTKESRWNPSARNASGAYGLCQALPATKMASAGADWETNPVTQLKWCNSYAIGRYKSWQAAYNFWINNHYW